MRRTTLAALPALALAATLVVAPSAGANTLQRGPDPTAASLAATSGPFAVSKTTVSSTAAGRGFGGGTIYHPTTTTAGTFGGIAISPGYTERQSAISWLGPRLASHGFVVFTIDTNSTLDQPDSRASQLLAALDHLTGSSSVRNRVDANRLAVMGHSMGGGGSLRAAATRTSLKATVPLTPYHLNKSWGGVRTPTLIIGAQRDTIASTSSHAVPFYNSLPSTPGKAYLELAGASHTATNSANATVAKYSISWLKRFVDNDTRYSPFLCGPNHTADRAISDYRSTCPY
jgi:alpha-beta hydrolase superfamily lysophospholipase